MPTKIDINRQKRGRPTKPKQSANRKKCLEAYEKYYSAGTCILFIVCDSLLV